MSLTTAMSRSLGRLSRRAPPHSLLPASSTCNAGRLLPSSRVPLARLFSSALPRYEAISASELQFGQPLHETHPHMVKAGEITPGITAQEYYDRRLKLCEHLPKGSVVLVEAATLKWASGSVFYPFRQDCNFLYLTGFQEDTAVAAIQKVSDHPDDVIFHMFVHAKNPAMEQWAGPRSGLVAARDVFNADSAHDITELPLRLPEILKHATKVYADIQKPKPGTDGGKLWELLREGSHSETSTRAFGKIERLSPFMDNLRMVKSKAEIANMRRAGRNAGRAITDLMRREWNFEQDIATALEYDVKRFGCTGLSFIPVIAGGKNALCVHYVHNNAPIPRDSLILVDAGGEYGNYVSDITRVWPQQGRFSTAQKDLYEALLNVQRRCVALCRESANNSLNDIHREARSGLAAELEKLGFSSAFGHIDKLFNHHVGHYVGLDVHDCASISRGIPLRAGHCVTIEPGIYVPHDSRYPAHFHGMGMRIEDSIAVDTDSAINLTAEAVKEIPDIEALRV